MVKMIRRPIGMTSRTVRSEFYGGIAAILIASTTTVTPAVAEDAALKAFPFVISCEFKKMHHLYYLSRLEPSGQAVYITPDRLAGMITIDGTAKSVGEASGGSCVGKTLKEMRAAGQTYDLRN